MTRARVFAKHRVHPTEDCVYIGRGTPWGNPFIIGRDGTREEVVERFKREILPDLDLGPLRGKHLLCHCAPLPCHGDAILWALGKRNLVLTQREKSMAFFNGKEWEIPF